MLVVVAGGVKLVDVVGSLIVVAVVKLCVNDKFNEVASMIVAPIVGSIVDTGTDNGSIVDTGTDNA